MKLFCTLILSANTAIFAQTPVTVTNTVAQSVPVTGYVQATTTEDIESARINMVAMYSFSDIAQKAVYNIPPLKRFHLQQITANCSSWAPQTQDFSLRLGTGDSDAFTWFLIHATQINTPTNGVHMLAQMSMPFNAVLDSGPIWIDGVRTMPNGFDTACNVVLLGYYTKVQPQILLKP